MNALFNEQRGGLITGLKVAIASKLLENHPNLRVGTIAGLVISEAERALLSSNQKVTDAIQEIHDQHQQLLDGFRQMADSKTELSVASNIRLAEELEAALQRIATSSPLFQESLNVIPDAELYALLQHLKRFHGGDFDRADPSSLYDLWKYRAAMTLALGPDHDYGIDKFERGDIAANFDQDIPSIIQPKPKTVILNLVRRQYLKALASYKTP